MVVGTIGERTDLAIIGAGPGGYAAALGAADAGMDVVVIDSGPLGGTCLNVGCIPSKALIELADLRHRAAGGSALGLSADGAVDQRAIRAHLDETTAGLANGVRSLLDSAGVKVVLGRAHFARYDRLSIESGDLVSHLEFDNVIVATGSRPIELGSFPIGGRVLDSTGALALTTLPRSMAIIGGGYIGVELGTAFAKLGVQVSIIEAADRILPGIPQVLAKVVQRRLGALGVRVVTGQTASEPTPAGVMLSAGEEVPAEAIVVAVGRRPNSDGCSLDTTGAVVTSSGHVQVNAQRQAARGVYAIGDLTAGPALAHKATAEAKVAIDTIAGHRAVFDPAAVPAVIFSDPEVFTVGVTPEEVEHAGMRVDRFPHSASARAKTMSASAGLTLIVSDQAGTVVASTQ